MPAEEARLERCGYARMRDLESAPVISTLREMEAFQASFMAATRSIWREGFAFSGDSLYGWSRRWEYPYCWCNLTSRARARVLDAGSGVTFFPFFLERKGFEVHCVDSDASLHSAFATANRALGSHVSFDAESLTRLNHPDATFDAVVCVSVLEHVSEPQQAVREMARVLRPGGRLVVTCDISLDRTGDILLEDFAVLTEELRSVLRLAYPLDLHRASDLLTTNAVRATEPWRLPWRPRRGGRLARAVHHLLAGDEFRSVAVVGSVWAKPDTM